MIAAASEGLICIHDPTESRSTLVCADTRKHVEAQDPCSHKTFSVMRKTPVASLVTIYLSLSDVDDYTGPAEKEGRGRFL